VGKTVIIFQKLLGYFLSTESITQSSDGIGCPTWYQVSLFTSQFKFMGYFFHLFLDRSTSRYDLNRGGS
jgi:hypothetical protein